MKLYCMIIFASGERIAGAEVNRGVAQFGRAPRSGRGGRKFESCRLDDDEDPQKCFKYSVSEDFSMSERHAVFIEMGPENWDPLGP